MAAARSVHLILDKLMANIITRRSLVQSTNEELTRINEAVLRQTISQMNLKLQQADQQLFDRAWLRTQVKMDKIMSDRERKADSKDGNEMEVDGEEAQ
jgi:hypothetical protein